MVYLQLCYNTLFQQKCLQKLQNISFQQSSQGIKKTKQVHVLFHFLFIYLCCCIPINIQTGIEEKCKQINPSFIVCFPLYRYVHLSKITVIFSGDIVLERKTTQSNVVKQFGLKKKGWVWGVNNGLGVVPQGWKRRDRQVLGGVWNCTELVLYSCSLLLRFSAEVNPIWMVVSSVMVTFWSPFLSPLYPFLCCPIIWKGNMFSLLFH